MSGKKRTLEKDNEKLKLNKIARKQKLQERGITLIALVVTIIILLILVGVTLNIALSDNGLFSKTKEAADKYQKAQEDEEKELLKYDYEIAKSQGKIDETITSGQYSIETQIKEKYGQDIKLGDTVNYEAGVEGYDGTWKVLGVENGQVLLMSSKPVKENFEISGKDGYLHMEEKLDNECVEYGKGSGAKSARSLRVEDINKITGYNPANPENIEKYGKGGVNEYGEKVTFTLDENEHVKCVCSNEKELETNLTSFYHIDGRSLGTEGIKEISIVNNYYKYSFGDDERYSNCC